MLPTTKSDYSCTSCIFPLKQQLCVEMLVMHGRQKQSFTNQSQITQQQHHHKAAHKCSQILEKLFIFRVEISGSQTGAVACGGAPPGVCNPEYSISGLSTGKQKAIKRQCPLQNPSIISSIVWQKPLSFSCQKWGRNSA